MGLRVVAELSSDIDPPDAVGFPDAPFVQQWIGRVLRDEDVRRGGALLDDATLAQCSVSVHLTDDKSSQTLNREYRGADKPTNVLSFPSELPPLDGILTLGDLVLCPSVVNREAAQQGKEPEHHWAHMLVHGTLHLLGYDHIDDDTAERMESLEIQLLSAAGIPDPYRGAARELDE